MSSPTYFPPGDPFAVQTSEQDTVAALERLDPSLAPGGIPRQDPNLSPGNLPPIRNPIAPHIPGLPGTNPAHPLANPQSAPAQPAPQFSPTSEMAEGQPPAVDPAQAPALPQPNADGSLTTLGQVAAEFNSPEDQFIDSLSVGSTDDPDNLVPLAHVIETYRANPDAIATAAQRDTLEEEFATHRSELGEMHDEALLRTGKLAEFLAEQIAGQQLTEYQLEKLKAEDPDGYAVETQRNLQMRQALQEAQDRFRGEADKRLADQGVEREEFKTREMRKTQSFWPEYANPVTRPGVEAKMQAYLGTVGFTREMIADVTDSRMLKVIKSAMENEEANTRGRQAIENASRQGVPVPKAAPQARGEMLSQQGADTVNQHARFVRAKESGGLDDAAAAIKGLRI